MTPLKPLRSVRYVAMWPKLSNFYTRYKEQDGVAYVL